MIVAYDYFTKWVKAEAVAEVTEKKVIGFVYNYILSRFGVAHTLVIDNGTQFNYKGIWIFMPSMETSLVTLQWPIHNPTTRSKPSIKL